MCAQDREAGGQRDQDGKQGEIDEVHGDLRLDDDTLARHA